MANTLSARIWYIEIDYHLWQKIHYHNAISIASYRSTHSQCAIKILQPRCMPSKISYKLILYLNVSPFTHLCLHLRKIKWKYVYQLLSGIIWQMLNSYQAHGPKWNQIIYVRYIEKLLPPPMANRNFPTQKKLIPHIHTHIHMHLHVE